MCKWYDERCRGSFIELLYGEHVFQAEVPALLGAESELPLTRSCALDNLQCAGRTVWPSPGPGASPQRTHYVTWTPLTRTSGFSAGLGSWAFHISWGHEAQIYFPAASPRSRFSAQSAPLLQSTLCMEEIEHIFHFSSCRAPFSRTHLQELGVYLPCL